MLFGFTIFTCDDCGKRFVALDIVFQKLFLQH